MKFAGLSRAFGRQAGGGPVPIGAGVARPGGCIDAPIRPAMHKWLLVFNCTNIGLANCLRLLAADLEVEATDYGSFRRESADYRKRLGDFELVITAPHFVSNEHIDFRSARALQTLPTIYFDAYHPDLCYLSTEAGILKGPLGDYHSKIITAAYQHGVAERDVRGLFSRQHYRAFGYLDRWARGKQRLLDGFTDAGCPVDHCFSRWSARGTFMHSVNHPSIHVLYDVACVLLDKHGIGYQRSGLLPHDNLLNGPVWPVFDEIAESLSVPGSYQFKLPKQYRCIGLDEFIARSYAMLAQLEPGQVECHQAQRASFDQVRAAL